MRRIEERPYATIWFSFVESTYLKNDLLKIITLNIYSLNCLYNCNTIEKEKIYNPMKYLLTKNYLRIKESGDRKKCLETRYVLYAKIWDRRWSARSLEKIFNPETFNFELCTISSNVYANDALRSARIPLMSNSCVQRRDRARARSDLRSSLTLTRGQSRDLLDAHRGKSAAVQPWNWNNGTVRGAIHPMRNR